MVPELEDKPTGRSSANLAANEPVTEQVNAFQAAASGEIELRDLMECPPGDLMEGGPGDLKECRPPGDLAMEGGPGDLMEGGPGDLRPGAT